MPAIPFILPVAKTAAPFVVGGLMSKKSQGDALKRSPEEAAAVAGGQGAAGMAMSGGKSLMQSGQAAQAGPMNYYQTLLRGNRAAMTQAVAPSIAQATDVFRGAERGYDRAGLRGAARDVATADLGRARASHIASLTTGVQPAAAAALAAMGEGQIQQGAGLYGTAGNIYSNLLSDASQHRQWATKEGTASGQAWGGLTRDIIGAITGKKSGGGGGGDGAPTPWLPQQESLPSPWQYRYGSRF